MSRKSVAQYLVDQRGRLRPIPPKSVRKASGPKVTKPQLKSVEVRQKETYDSGSRSGISGKFGVVLKKAVTKEPSVGNGNRGKQDWRAVLGKRATGPHFDCSKRQLKKHKYDYE